MTANHSRPRFGRLSTLPVLLGMVALGGCASGETQPEEGANSSEETAEERAEQLANVQRTRDYLEQAGLVSVPWAHTRGRATLVATNLFFAEIESSAGRYLLETAEECEPITRAARNARLTLGKSMTTQGTSNRVFRAEQDEIYGCLIEAIYELPDQGAGPLQ